MESVVFAMALIGRLFAVPQPQSIQFGAEALGRPVMVCLDGVKVETTFAGKLRFRDRNRAWLSVCAGVRNPVAVGQIFDVRPFNSGWIDGTPKLAGNIVAEYFKFATTADQAAGLQVAVWEAIEDGGKLPDFDNGRFAVRTTPAVLDFAAKYYAAVDKPGVAVFLQTTGAGQPQITPAVQ